MHLSKRLMLALLALATLAGSAATAVSAVASPTVRHSFHRARVSLLDTSLAPSVPTDPILFGSTPGGAPWVLRFGRADLRSDGHLDVVIRGLVIPVAPFTGTAGPVTVVDASLYCNGSSTPVGTTPSVPITQNGDARIRAQLTLPATCLAPALLIHPNNANTVYIASSGFSTS